MATVIKSGSAIDFAVTPGSGGWPATAFSVSRSVIVDGVPVWSDPTPIAWADVTTAGVVNFPGVNYNDPTTFALYTIEFNNEMGLPELRLYNEVIVEANDLLRPLVNSFGTWAEVSVAAHTMAQLRSYKYSTDADKKAALITAYHNIGDLQVDFNPPRRVGRYHDQSKFWDDTGLVATDLDRIHSTRQLTAETWAELKEEQRQKLLMAQIIEADYLLSDHTPEKQRLAGLLSHGAGETTHFYRTTKPLELPVCRAVALSLKGIISYVVRIGG